MQRPRTPSRISDSLHRRLNSYALAASAAGVGLLALAQPAEGKIVYTKAHQVIRDGDRYALDLNGDGITDFTIWAKQCTTSSCLVYKNELGVFGASVSGGQNAISITTFTGRFAVGIAAALKRGSKIAGQHTEADAALAEQVRSNGYYGNWFNVEARYLGFVFYIKKREHYGWARLNVRTHEHPFRVAGLLTGYAYETIPNKPIIAGKTNGRDVITLQDASLGHLARGASALPAWRGGK